MSIIEIANAQDSFAPDFPCFYPDLMRNTFDSIFLEGRFTLGILRKKTGEVMKKTLVVALSMGCLFAVSVLPAFAQVPAKEHRALEQQTEEHTEQAAQALENVGGCPGCKGCKSGWKIARCTGVVSSAVAVCVATDAAACAPAILSVFNSGCCACLPSKLQDLCNALN